MELPFVPESVEFTVMEGCGCVLVELVKGNSFVWYLKDFGSFDKFKEFLSRFCEEKDIIEFDDENVNGCRFTFYIAVEGEFVYEMLGELLEGAKRLSVKDVDWYPKYGEKVKIGGREVVVGRDVSNVNAFIAKVCNKEIQV